MTLTSIIFAGILTYFTRMTMIALISRDMLGYKIKAVLEYVPSAVFPAIIFPGIFINDYGTFIEINDPKLYGAGEDLNNQMLTVNTLPQKDSWLSVFWHS